MNVDVLHRYITARRVRDRVFGDGLSADPAWDILLDLMVARADGRRISVNSACIAAAVPATTGLRHVQNLCDRGLIDRHPDSADRRRTYLRFTDAGDRTVDAFFAAVTRRVIPATLARHWNALDPDVEVRELDRLNAIVDQVRRLVA